MRLVRIGVVATLLAPLLGVLPAAAMPVQAAPQAAPRLMLVGDSITQGSAGDYTWRHRLWKHLAAHVPDPDFVGPNIRLYDNVRSSGGTVVGSDAYADPTFDTAHNALSGRFVGSFAGYPTGAKDTIRADVQSYQPDYLMALLGINDLFWFATREPALVAGDMATLIDNARAVKPNLRVVLVAVPPTRAALTDATLAGRVTAFNQRLSGLATTKSTALSPIAYVPPPVGYQPDYEQEIHDSYDGTHPNARGEIRIADAVADVLSARFGLGPAYPLSFAGVPTGPVLPFTLRCAPGVAQATLTWDESPGSTGYWIQRRIAGEPWEPSIYQLKITDSPMDNVWLYPGVTYEYRLQAAKMYDKGIFSNVCAVTPSGAAPRGRPDGSGEPPGR